MTRFSTPLRTLAAATVLCCGLAAQAADLTLAPSPVSVLPGASFSLDVNGSSFADNMVGGGFSLSWDPTLLRLDTRAIDTTVWPDPARSLGLLDAASGTLSDVFFNNVTAVLPTGSFHVARLDFTALAAGTSTVQLMASAGFPFGNELGTAVDVNFGSALVTAVPEPGTWALMALGMAAVAFRRRAVQA